jgi:hypothetical protein
MNWPPRSVAHDGRTGMRASIDSPASCQSAGHRHSSQHAISASCRVMFSAAVNRDK